MLGFNKYHDLEEVDTEAFYFVSVTSFRSGNEIKDIQQGQTVFKNMYRKLVNKGKNVIAFFSFICFIYSIELKFPYL